MRLGGLFHPELLAVIARVGHTDTVVIADAGLPIPPGTPRIELAVSAGLPDLTSVLRAVLGELVVESFTVASQTRAHSPDFYARLTPLLTAPVAEVGHEALKAMVEHGSVLRTSG